MVLKRRLRSPLEPAEKKLREIAAITKAEYAPFLSANVRPNQILARIREHVLGLVFPRRTHNEHGFSLRHQQAKFLLLPRPIIWFLRRNNKREERSVERRWLYLKGGGSDVCPSEPV